MTISMAPFMSCGARLTVYALFAAAFFLKTGKILCLDLPLWYSSSYFHRLDIQKAALHRRNYSFKKCQAYHIPVLRNILFTTWFRLKGFIFRATKTIVVVVIALSFLNSIGSDGSFGNEDLENSVLSAVGKTITQYLRHSVLKKTIGQPQ